MPEKVEEIAQALIADPNFQPQEGRTKEESAYAVANAQVQKMGNPEHPGVDENARLEIMELANDLVNQSDEWLSAHGRILRTAVSRGDWKQVKKQLGVIKEDAPDPATEEFIAYLQTVVGEQVKQTEGGDGQS